MATTRRSKQVSLVFEVELNKALIEGAHLLVKQLRVGGFFEPADDAVALKASEAILAATLDRLELLRSAERGGGGSRKKKAR